MSAPDPEYADDDFAGLVVVKACHNEILHLSTEYVDGKTYPRLKCPKCDCFHTTKYLTTHIPIRFEISRPSNTCTKNLGFKCPKFGKEYRSIDLASSFSRGVYALNDKPKRYKIRVFEFSAENRNRNPSAHPQPGPSAALQPSGQGGEV